MDFWIHQWGVHIGSEEPEPQTEPTSQTPLLLDILFKAAVLAKNGFDFSTEQYSTLDLPPLKALVVPSSCYGYCKSGCDSGCGSAQCRSPVNRIEMDLNL